MAEGILQLNQAQGDTGQTLLDDAAQMEGKRNVYNLGIRQENIGAAAEIAGAAVGTYAAKKRQDKRDAQYEALMKSLRHSGQPPQPAAQGSVSNLTHDNAPVAGMFHRSLMGYSPDMGSEGEEVS